MMTDHYLADDTHDALADSLAALANPHDLRDRIVAVLGEVGGIWPASIHPDNVDRIAVTVGDRRAAKRYRKILETGETMMAKPRSKVPVA